MEILNSNTRMLKMYWTTVLEKMNFPVTLHHWGEETRGKQASTTHKLKKCAKCLLYICNCMFSPHIPVITLCLPLISLSEATLALTIMKHGSNDLQLLSINTYSNSCRHYQWQWNYIFIKPIQIIWDYEKHILNEQQVRQDLCLPLKCV